MGYTPPYLEVRKITGGWSASGPSSTTTDDLYIYPNTGTTNNSIVLNGTTSPIVINCDYLSINKNAGAEILQIGYTSPDITFTGIAANKNISLIPNGTGKVKFGSFTASGDVAVNGSVDILDSAGNARKLATIA